MYLSLFLHGNKIQWLWILEYDNVELMLGSACKSKVVQFILLLKITGWLRQNDPSQINKLHRSQWTEQPSVISWFQKSCCSLFNYFSCYSFQSSFIMALLTLATKASPISFCSSVFRLRPSKISWVKIRFLGIYLNVLSSYYVSI